MCCVVDFCLYAAVLRMERCADLVSVFFGTYGGTLGRSAICDLVLGFFGTYNGTLCRSAIWFWDSSVLIVVRCADLQSGSGILRYL